MKTNKQKRKNTQKCMKTTEYNIRTANRRDTTPSNTRYDTQTIINHNNKSQVTNKEIKKRRTH